MNTRNKSHLGEIEPCIKNTKIAYYIFVPRSILRYFVLSILNCPDSHIYRTKNNCMDHEQQKPGSN